MKLKFESLSFKAEFELNEHINILVSNSATGKTRLFNDLVMARANNDLHANVDVNDLVFYTTNIITNTTLQDTLTGLTDRNILIIDEVNMLITTKTCELLRDTPATVLLMYRGIAFEQISAYKRLSLKYDANTHVYTITHNVVDDIFHNICKYETTAE